jgi:hypothetical protein
MDVISSAVVTGAATGKSYALKWTNATSPPLVDEDDGAVAGPTSPVLQSQGQLHLFPNVTSYNGSGVVGGSIALYVNGSFLLNLTVPLIFPFSYDKRKLHLLRPCTIGINQTCVVYIAQLNPMGVPWRRPTGRHSACRGTCCAPCACACSCTCPMPTTRPLMPMPMRMLGRPLSQSPWQ